MKNILVTIVAVLTLFSTTAVIAEEITHPHRTHVTQRYNDPVFGLYVQLEVAKTQTDAINTKVQQLQGSQYQILKNVANAAVVHLDEAIQQFDEAYKVTQDHTVSMSEARLLLTSPNARVHGDLRAIESIKQSMLYLIILEALSIQDGDNFKEQMLADTELSNNYSSAMFYQNESWVTANAILWHVVDSMLAEREVFELPVPVQD